MAVDKQRARRQRHANAPDRTPAWTPGSKQEAFATRVFEINIERAAAKQILRDIVEQGLTPELHERARDFLASHSD